MDIAVLGLGEAGARYAIDLVASGHHISGFDPADITTPEGVNRRSSIKQTVPEADLVISFTGARFCLAAAQEAAEHLKAGAIFADFNTGSPSVKRAIESAFQDKPGIAADVAVLAPVPRAGVRTPLLASGEGANAVVRFFREEMGSDAAVADGPMGVAASRKLLRSVFMKGLAAVVIEADEAAALAGSREWVREQMAREIGPGLVDRLIAGTHEHAERRLHEMEDTEAFLDELGSPSEITVATTAWLERLVREKTTI